MNNASSALANAGNSFEESVALLTAANTVIQDISKSSTGLRTITARLRSTTVELDELGEAMTDAEYEELVQALTDCNVSLKDQNGEFRSTYDIMADIAAQWDNLTSMEQSAIANAAAGNRQQTVFFSIIEQFQNSAADAVEAMQNSEGSLQGAYDEYMESTTAHLGTLKSTLQELASELFTQDFLNGWIDAGTKLLEFANKIADLQTKVGGLSTALKVLVGILAISKSQSILSGVASFVGVFERLHNALSFGSGASGLYELSGLSKAVTQIKDAFAAAKTEGKGLSRIIELISKSSAASNAILLGVAAAITAIVVAVKLYKESNPTFDDLIEQAEEMQQAIDDLNEQLDTNKERIVELQELKAQGTISIVEQQELTDLERENALLQLQIDLQEELLRIKNQEIAAEAASNAEDFFAHSGDENEWTSSSQYSGWSYESGYDILKQALNNYRQAKSDYDQAVADGNLELANTITADMQGSASIIDGYLSDLTEMRNNIDDTTESGKELATQLDDAILEIAAATGNTDYIKNAFAFLPEDLDERTTQLQHIMTILSQYGYSASMIAYSYKGLGLTVDDVRVAFDAWYQSRLEAEDTASEIAKSEPYLLFMNILLGLEEEGAEAAKDEADAFQELSDATSNLVSEQETLQKALNEQSTGGSISVETFQSLLEISGDYADCLEYVNGSIQLNTEKVNALTEAKIAEQEATNDANKAALQSKYLQNAAKIASLRKELSGLNDTESDTYTAIQANIASLLEENGTIRSQCAQYDLLNAALEEATSAYNNWQNAQSSANQGDMFDSAVEAVNYIDEVLNNSDSENYLRVGVDDYTAAVDFLVPDTVDKEDTDAVNSYLDKLEDLFVFDDDGNWFGLDLASFYDRAIEAGLMEYDEASDQYKVAGEKSMAEFADGLGLSLPLVQAIFGELEEYGQVFDWSDEANKTIGDLAVSADVAAEHLREAFADDGWEIDIDVSDCETAQEQVDKLDDAIQDAQDLKATLEVDSEEYQDAQDIIRYCIAQKQILETPAILQVDTSKVSEQTQEAVALVQDFVNAQNQVELETALGIDTTSSQAALDSATEALQNSTNPILEKIGIDQTSSQDEINAALSAMTIEEIDGQVILKVNDDEVISYEADDETATVYYSVNHKAVDLYDPDDLRRTVYYYPQLVGGLTNFGIGSVSGTAHVNGTAMASGDWRTKSGGRVLTGELGPEIVVDGRTGTWYTVGDNGPEFVNIPKGSIVFNHLQTASLLNNGYAIGRASALANGTAMVTGGGSASLIRKAASAQNTSNVRATKAYTASTNTVSSTTASSSSVGSSAESEEDSWFERMYAYHQHLVAMEQETDEEYLDWLTDAYQRAYNEGILEIEDFYSYQEECFELTKSLFEDYVNDLEHDNSVLEHFTGTEQQIIDNNKALMSSLEAQIEAAYKRGLDNNSEYVQDLQDQWFDARDAITEIQDELYENAKDAVEELIDFRIDMIKQDLENQQDALDDELDALQDFYDEQKSMLEEQYDEEDYLREQSEKRKSVSDIQSEINALQFDNSAWAEKRKVELADELADAQEELDDLERERARDEAEALLDAQQLEQETLINSKMDAITTALNNPKDLYTTALNDIKNNMTPAMYQAMIDYNAKYGSGKDEDVAELVDNAYGATTLVDQTYKGIAVDNLAQADVEAVGATSAAGKAAAQGTWDTTSVNTDVIKANDTSATTATETSKETSTSTTSTSTTTTKSYPYGKASDTSGNIGYGASGNSVRAIQYALNQLGYGNSGTKSLDGQFGSGTKKAVQSFQGAYGLSQDGIVGAKTRRKFSILGYATGTDYATGGLHEIDELGSEYLFTSSDGSRYRVLNAGDKVLNAEATEFLYDFANGGKQFLYNMIRSMFSGASLAGISSGDSSCEITMGDIVINGNATQQTVSEIRRAQRENVDYMLKQLKKLNT